MGRLSLRTKILLITGLTGGLVATLLSVVFTVQMRDALRKELGSRARVVSIQLASNLAAGQTLGTGTSWTFAAQTSGSGTVHPTTGDTYTVTYTTGGVTFTQSGNF